MKTDLGKLWLQSDEPLTKIIPKSKEAKKTICIATVNLAAYKGTNYNSSKEREQAQVILKEDSKPNEELFFFFQIAWANAAIRGANLAEAEMLLERFETHKKLIPEKQSMIINAKGFLASARGNKIEREKSLLKCLSIVPKTSAHYELIVLDYMNFLSGMARLKDFQKLKYQFKKPRSKLLELSVRLGNYFQTCQIKKHQQIADSLDFKKDSVKNVFNYSSMMKNQKLLTYQYDLDHHQQKISSHNLEIYEKWYVSNSYLKEKDSINGLAWAIKLSNEHKVGIQSNNVLIYTLIRAEISNKNINAATRLLNEILNTGYLHYLHDFFFARIELLKGNQTKAEKLFKNTYECCLHYNALNRLFFEIDLACELSKHVVVQLLNKNIHTKAKPFSLSDTLEIETFETPSKIIGKSKPMLQLKKVIRKYAKTDTSILINGETGVGKEEVAQRLHDISFRSEAPFLAINCSAIAESLLHSELFGHLKGSYTGATQDHKGIFEAAEGGTVFLDEIGDIPERTQVSLLRILESSEVKPIGSSKAIKIKCHIIAATNKNLKEKVNEGNFREDLYYRLNRLEINVPPLRERNQDIILLAKTFLKADRSDKKQPDFSTELQTLMLDFPWPGNVRQLKNEMEKLRLNHSEKLNYNIEDFELVQSKTTNQQIRLNANQPVQKEPSAQLRSDNSLQATIKSVISNEKTPLRRREKIREMFIEVKTLTRGEITKILNVAPGTITTDLKVLEKENFIIRIKPSASTRTHYFQLKE